MKIFMKKITIEEFKKFKEKVKEFITDDAETFYYRFLMESIHNPNFMVKVNKIIDYVSRDRSAHEIEELFNILRAEGEQKFINADKATDEITKVNENLSGLAYFCLVEALNENSSFSEKIIKDIKGKYGNKYLETLSRIDRSYLSVDGKKVLKEENKSSLPNDEEMKKYIIMKKWQDKQRTYSFRRIRPLYLKEEKYIGEKEPNLMRLHEKTLIKRAMQDLEKNELIEIDEIAKYCEAGLDKEMIKKFGGKAYGLAKLTAKGIHIPKTYCLAVDSKIQDINLTELDLTKKYAVRSSADIEDGGKNSFAGMFDSFLNVSIEDIEEKMSEVRSSVNNSRVKKYIEMNKLTNPSMGVIIQEYIEPEISGVWIGENKSSGILEWVNGNGEKLVSGKVNPNREKWSNGESDTKLTIQANGKVGKQLLEIQRKLSSNKSDIADMEWCIINGELVLLQYRPVTKELDLSKYTAEPNNESSIFKGTPASSGEVVGNAKFVRKIDELKQWNDGDILMAWFTDPDWLDLMSRSSGLITAVGGLLCHSAIIARELGIPCVTGIGGTSMKKIWNEEKMYVNGNTGEVCTEKVYEKIKNKEIIKGGEER